MKTLLLALMLAVGSGPVVAAETARGSFKSQNLGMTIKSALAFPGTSLLDKTPVIVVAVTSAEMDTDGLAAYYDRRRAIDRRVMDNDTGVVFVEFKPDGSYRGYSFYFARGNGCGYCGGNMGITTEEACRDAARRDDDVALIDIDTRFRDFGDYWSPFLGSHGPAPVFAMSLGEISRARLRERIRDRRPIRSDGSIHLIARAWPVRSRVPC